MERLALCKGVRCKVNHTVEANTFRWGTTNPAIRNKASMTV